MKEEKVKEPRPQDDVPEEVIIHYIVKDYRRMYFQQEDYIKKIEILRDKVKTINRQLQARQVKALTDEKLRIMLRGLQKKADAYDALKEENAKLQSHIEEIKSSRNAVVEAVTGDLEDKLKEANRRIGLLAQAVSEPEKADPIFLHQCKVHTIETDDDRKWMSSAMKQLEKAATNLLTVEERLDTFAHNLEAANASKIEYTEKTMKPLGKAIAKISSVVSHIECFFDKIGDIKIAEDE